MKSRYYLDISISTLPALRVPDVHVVAGDHHWAAGAGAAGEGAGQREVARGVLKKQRFYHYLPSIITTIYPVEMFRITWKEVPGDQSMLQ